MEEKISKYNKTRLLPEQERRIHRDYIAHCLRWDFVCHYFKNIVGKSAVLDVGCGEGHLLEVLWRNLLSPAVYIGVDVDKKALNKALNARRPAESKVQHDFYWADFCDLEQVKDITKTINPKKEDKNYFDIITCFEVLEHLPNMEEAQKMLNNMYYVLDKGGYFAVSTPTRFSDNEQVTCKNHLFEYTHGTFIEAVRQTGCEIIQVYGTMMYVRHLPGIIARVTKENPEFARIFNILRSYFSSNLTGTLLAPAFPEFSRSQMIIGRKI